MQATPRVWLNQSLFILYIGYRMVAFNGLGVAYKKWVTTTAPLAKSAGIVLQSLPTAHKAI